MLRKLYNIYGFGAGMLLMSIGVFIGCVNASGENGNDPKYGLKTIAIPAVMQSCQDDADCQLVRIDCNMSGIPDAINKTYLKEYQSEKVTQCEGVHGPILELRYCNGSNEWLKAHCIQGACHMLCDKPTP